MGGGYHTRGGFRVTWQHRSVALGLGEAVGPPLSFAGPWVTYWECGGVSVGAQGAQGGKYIPADVLRRVVAVVTVLAAVGPVG